MELFLTIRIYFNLLFYLYYLGRLSSLIIRSIISAQTFPCWIQHNHVIVSYHATRESYATGQ